MAEHGRPANITTQRNSRIPNNPTSGQRRFFSSSFTIANDILDFITLLVMIIIWLSWLLPLWPWYVFILSRWLYWHYHNESHHSAPPRLPRKRLFQQKLLSNFSISAIEKLYISFCHQNSLEKIHKLELLAMWSNETQVCAQQAGIQGGADALI